MQLLNLLLQNLSNKINLILNSKIIVNMQTQNVRFFIYFYFKLLKVLTPTSKGSKIIKCDKVLSNKKIMSRAKS